MAGIFAPIPMPQNGIDAFMTGMQQSQNMFDSFMKNKLTPYQIELLKAQSQEAQGKGAAETMKANILQRALNHGQSPGSLPQGIFNSNYNEPPITGNVPQGTYAPTPNAQPIGQRPAPLSDGQEQPNVNNLDQQKIATLQPGESYVIGSAAKQQASQPAQSSQSDSDLRAPSTMPPAAQAQADNDLQGNRTGVMQNPAQSDELASELLGLPVKEETVAGYHYSKNPLTGETIVTRRGQTPEEKSNLESATVRKNSFSREDAKLASTYDTQSMSADNTLNTLEQIGKTVYSPEWAEMRKAAAIPGGGKASLWWYAHNGTPEQQKMASAFSASTGQIVGNMAQNFKGQFRKGEQSLINGMKINDTDTALGAQGKYEALVSMEKFMSNRSRLMSNLIRQGKSPSDAADIADSSLKGNLVRKMADERAGISKSTKAEHDRLTKLANEAIAKNPSRKEEILSDLDNLTRIE